MEGNTLDVNKVFKAIAHIIGKRENMEITVVEVKKKKETKEESA